MTGQSPGTAVPGLSARATGGIRPLFSFPGRAKVTPSQRLPAGGGSWRSGAFHGTAVAHDPGSLGTKGDNIGFRVVVTVSPAK